MHYRGLIASHCTLYILRIYPVIFNIGLLHYFFRLQSYCFFLIFAKSILVLFCAELGKRGCRRPLQTNAAQNYFSYHTRTTKACAFAASFDFLRFSTTFTTQIYTQKLTLNVSVYKPYLSCNEFSKSVEFSENQAFGLLRLSWCSLAPLCYPNIIVPGHGRLRYILRSRG